MESFTRELLSNACAHFFPDNSHSPFTKFLPEQLNLKGQSEIAISEKILTIKVPKCYRGKFVFFDKIFSKSSEFYELELACYRSITEFVEPMNTLIHERQNHSESCIRIKVSQRTQKFEIYPANEGSGLVFFSRDLGHIFGRNVGNEFEVMLRGKRLHKPNIINDLVRILTHDIHGP